MLRTCNIGVTPVPPQIINNSSQHPSILFGLSKEVFADFVGEIGIVGEVGEVEGTWKITLFSGALFASLSLPETSNGPRTWISNPFNCSLYKE